MNINDLKRVIISFADSSSDVEISKGEITAIIRGETIEAKIIEKDGELYILEDGIERKAKAWIAIRLAQLEQLADRISEYVVTIPDFIHPSGKMLDDVENDPTETEQDYDDVIPTLTNKLQKRLPGTTSVMYLTSDAGEGKTTVINHLAVTQARKFKRKETNWLLVPIPLGGRGFLRFDDIVVISLVNRLRFRLFYYESFIELVKLGLLVPAFDGFEEMFMENANGEALSATGNLMSKLESAGTVLIAARQAYFDYKNFSSQARLFDTIGANSVMFSKVSINRWSKRQFVEYASNRGINKPEDIYTFVSERLGQETHPLLTRPVLVNRLLDVVQSIGDLERITVALDNPSEYFQNFVDAIIVREAREKWIDRSGEPFVPLLTVSQHYELLSFVAEEMWVNNTDSLSTTIIDFIADLYSESKKFDVKASQQIKERLRQHALIVKSDQGFNYLKFDHIEFQNFFLGVAFFRALIEGKPFEFKSLMRRGTLSLQTAESIISNCVKEGINIEKILEMFTTIQLNEGPASFVKENCGSLILKMISLNKAEGVLLENYFFPSNSLSGVTINSIQIKTSHFQTTSLTRSQLSNSTFVQCTFDGIEVDYADVTIFNSLMKLCEISFVQDVQSDKYIYNPDSIKSALEKMGFRMENILAQSEFEDENGAVDEDLELVEKALRRFIRGSQINDNVFKMRLGQKAEYFLQELLPLLLQNQIIGEVKHIGAGQKRRFKLMVPFDKINYALKESKGKFDRFMKLFDQESM